MSAAEEKQSILNLYQDLFDEGLIPVPDVLLASILLQAPNHEPGARIETQRLSLRPYWQAVAAQDSSAEAPPVLELQDPG